MASSTHQPVTPAASKENISPLFRPYIRHHAYTPFYKAVCARFSKHAHPTLPKKRQSTAAEAAASAAMIDWRGMDRIVRPENLPEEEDESDVASNIADPVYNPLYQAQGKYEFMNRKPLKGVKTLQYLGSGAMSSAYIKSAFVNIVDGSKVIQRKLSYICKTWSLSTQGHWRGFHSELALYKSSRYLLPLQGDCITQIMGVYARPGFINIAMEPPHPIFWVEASPDMSIYLKERVIEAFKKIHSRGIAHGDIALRHILIGANLKVTIVDFQESHASEPLEAVGLGKVFEGEMRREMRRVKFLLNYDGARKKEIRKTKAMVERLGRNAARAEVRRTKAVAVTPDEPTPLEDELDPPIEPEEMKNDWLVGVNNAPRRFVMPGVPKETLGTTISDFLRRLFYHEWYNHEYQPSPSPPPSPQRPETPPPEDGPKPPAPLPPSIKVHDYAYDKTYAGEKAYTVGRPPTKTEAVAWEKYNELRGVPEIKPRGANSPGTSLKRRREGKDDLSKNDTRPPSKKVRFAKQNGVDGSNDVANESSQSDDDDDKRSTRQAGHKYKIKGRSSAPNGDANSRRGKSRVNKSGQGLHGFTTDGPVQYYQKPKKQKFGNKARLEHGVLDPSTSESDGYSTEGHPGSVDSRRLDDVSPTSSDSDVRKGKRKRAQEKTMEQEAPRPVTKKQKVVKPTETTASMSTLSNSELLALYLGQIPRPRRDGSPSSSRGRAWSTENTVFTRETSRRHGAVTMQTEPPRAGHSAARRENEEVLASHLPDVDETRSSQLGGHLGGAGTSSIEPVDSGLSNIAPASEARAQASDGQAPAVVTGPREDPVLQDNLSSEDEVELMLTMRD